MSQKGTYITLYMNKQILKSINFDIRKIGHGSNISAWISQACKEKIEGKNKSVEIILKKLKDWINSFPRKPINEIIKEIEMEYNGEI